MKYKLIASDFDDTFLSTTGTVSDFQLDAVKRFQNAGGKFMLYNNEGMSEIVIEKKELVSGVQGGNISDLGGYYNELVYFCHKAAKGEKIEKATLCDGVSSLEFLKKELAYNA